MPAGAGGLKGVTTNSEHLLFRIIYIMLTYKRDILINSFILRFLILRSVCSFPINL